MKLSRRWDVLMGESREVKSCQRKASQGVKSSCAKAQWQESTKHHVWSGVDIVQGFAEDKGRVAGAVDQVPEF